LPVISRYAARFGDIDQVENSNQLRSNLRLTLVRGYPPNGICRPCACLLAGGCGEWWLLARRTAVATTVVSVGIIPKILQVDILTKVPSSQELAKKSAGVKTSRNSGTGFLHRMSMGVLLA